MDEAVKLSMATSLDSFWAPVKQTYKETSATIVALDIQQG